MATDHYRKEEGNLVWAIAQLPPGNYTQIEVQYECVKAAVKAGSTVSVSSSEGAQAQDAAYLEIRPAAAASRPGTHVRRQCAGDAPGDTTRGRGTRRLRTRRAISQRNCTGGEIPAAIRRPGKYRRHAAWRGTPGGTPWSARAKTDENKGGERSLRQYRSPNAPIFVRL